MQTTTHHSVPARHRLRNPRLLRPQTGFSLVEALVSVVILSVAMLGLAYLQVQGAKFTMSSYGRTQATILAADMMDKAKLHGQDAVLIDAAAACDPLSVDPAVDKRCWLDRVAATLPEGSAETSANGSTLEIRIAWQDRTTRSDGTPTMSAPIDRELVWSIEL